MTDHHQTILSLLSHGTPWWRAIAPALPWQKIGIDGSMYMTRYTLNKQEGLSIYLHEFHREDWARETHDHPWPFWHQILEGGYIEEVLKADGLRFEAKRRPGYQAYREATHKHRVAKLLGYPCWSLVVVGPRVREWGFDCPDGWVAFNEHMKRGGICADGGAA